MASWDYKAIWRWETLWHVLKKVKHTPMLPPIDAILRNRPNRMKDLYTNVYSNVSHNSQKSKIFQYPLTKQISKHLSKSIKLHMKSMHRIICKLPPHCDFFITYSKTEFHTPKFLFSSLYHHYEIYLKTLLSFKQLMSSMWSGGFSIRIL